MGKLFALTRLPTFRMLLLPNQVPLDAQLAAGRA